jgi:hypothetical protein
MTTTVWRWGCVRCGESGAADSPAHAVGLGRGHEAYACPLTPGLEPGERARRLAWWKVRRERYGLDGAGGTLSTERDESVLAGLLDPEAES